MKKEIKDKILRPFEGHPTYEKTRLLYWKIRKYKSCKNINLQIQKRKNGFIDQKYLKLKELKNKYSGERCFIIATGPSLTIDDLEKLENEYTFGMNSIIKLFDKTSFRPDFYGIQDRYVYGAMKNEIEKVSLKTAFCADQIEKYYNVPKNFIIFPYDEYYHLFNGKLGEYNAKFSDNAYNIVYDGYSITYSLIEIAVYMGFNEIYLLGCDCSYPKGSKSHIVESGFVDKNAMKNPIRMRVGYKCAKEYAENHDIKIYNATRGGELETFERVDLDEVLKNKNKNKEVKR